MSPEAHAITSLFIITLCICAVIFAVVAGLVGYSLARYRWRKGDPDPAQVAGNKRMEIVWTAIPFVIVLALFGLTVRAMEQADPAPPPGGPDLDVIGHQWWWEVRSPKLGYVTANEIHIPVGKDFLVRLDTTDVLHEFWVPQLGRKMTTLPGAGNEIWLRADEPGIYEGACTEFCGTEHAWMRVEVIAESQEKYLAWVHEQQQAALPVQGEAARGREDFLTMTCVNCHAIKGVGGTENAGPDLTHVASRRYLAGRLLPNTPANLRRWLTNPQAVKQGALMPNFKLTPAQVGDLAAYFEALK
ncbi:MAG TPA: cytochrome c oxidase subunit II [Opitutus sp.]|nr:cytochrome c oxidase subunit II [Opitutus sp.]